MQYFFFLMKSEQDEEKKKRSVLRPNMGTHSMKKWDHTDGSTTSPPSLQHILAHKIGPRFQIFSPANSSFLHFLTKSRQSFHTLSFNLLSSIHFFTKSQPQAKLPLCHLLLSHLSTSSPNHSHKQSFHSVINSSLIYPLLDQITATCKASTFYPLPLQLDHSH